MQSKSFEAYFAARSTRTASSLDQIARALRSDGLLPSGVRGPHAPQLSPEQLADFTIAACMAPSPRDATHTVKEFGSLKPIHKLGKPMQRLLKEAGIVASEVNLHHYLTCLFWAGWDDAQKHITGITFRRLPPHPDLSSNLEVEIDGEIGWSKIFSKPGDDNVAACIIHNDAYGSLMQESVTLGTRFMRGLFKATRLRE